MVEIIVKQVEVDRGIFIWRCSYFTKGWINYEDPIQEIAESKMRQHLFYMKISEQNQTWTYEVQPDNSIHL
jgi:hypothetical protein